METTCLNVCHIHYNILPSNTFLKSKSALYTMVKHDQTPLACLLAGGGGGEHHTGGALLPELRTQPEAVSGQHHLHHQGRRVIISDIYRYVGPGPGRDGGIQQALHRHTGQQVRVPKPQPRAVRGGDLPVLDDHHHN